MTTDQRSAAAVATLYLMLAAVLLPPTTWAHMLGGGLILLFVVAWIAKRLGQRATPGWSIMAVTSIASAILAMPNFPAMGGVHRAAVPLGFLGAVAAALVWASYRWRPVRPSRERTSLGASMLMALLFAGILAAIATIPIVLMFLSRDPRASVLLLVYPAYAAGALAAAVIYWALQGVRYLVVGRYLLGALAGFCLYAAVGPVVMISEGDPVEWRMIAVMGAVCGVLVGPAVAFSIMDDEPAEA